MVDKTFEELGEYRDETGHIDMDKVLTDNYDVMREVRGKEQREKDWIEIRGGSVLIKTNSVDRCNGEYAELICDELAKQAGIETAKYDMITYKGERGLITENMCKPGEEMISLYELVGNGPNTTYPDVIDINYIFESLPEKLKLEGLDDESIDACMLKLRKQLLFDLCVMETDRHTENISFIKSKTDGKVSMRLSPMYDTESALTLNDNDIEHMEEMYTSYLNTSKLVVLQDPKMSVIPEKEEVSLPEDTSVAAFQFLMQLRKGVKTVNEQKYGSDSEEMIARTFEFLCEDERALGYWKTDLNRLDVNKAIASVETRIGTSLPEHISKMAIACFEERKFAMNYIIPSGITEKTYVEKVGKEDKEIDII